MTEPQRTFYPWDSLEVGDYFEILKSNPKGFNHVRQLVFLRNARMDKLNDTRRYKWFRDDEQIFVERVK